MRKTSFAVDEYYHIYNRGVDKRNIFLDEEDIERFYDSIEEFNALEPIGSLYENSFVKKLGSSTPKSEQDTLIGLAAHCANPNHFHLLLRQKAEKGIEKFMHKVGTGYTNYFNNKYERSGALFQGRFKSIHIDSNEYLLHVSAYINLNDRVHQLGSSTPKLVRSRSSWGEYTDDISESMCEKEIILQQFQSMDEYKKFALASLESILEKRGELKDLSDFLLE